MRSSSKRPEFQGFSEYYDSEIAPYLSARETERKSAVKKMLTAISIGVAAALTFAILFPKAVFLLHLVIVSLILSFVIGLSFISRTRENISEGLFTRISSYFEFSYKPKILRPSFIRTFQRLNLVGIYNEEKWEDEIKGRRNELDFTLCEAHLEKVTGSGKEKRKRTVFRGQLLVIEYPKKFLGETVVLRDQGIANRFSKPGKYFQNIGIASPRFEKIFEAWSTDQVEARDILDPVVLERFAELDRLFDGARIRAAFSDNHVYIALSNGDKINMGSMFKPLDGPDRVDKIMHEFELIFDLIDVLVKQLDGRTGGAFSVDDVRSG